MRRIEVDFNKIYSSNSFGNFIILNEEPSVKGIRYVNIKFLNTGSIRRVKLHHALSGEVRDLFAPTVRGVGYIGNYEGNLRSNPLYTKWESMLDRCFMERNECFQAYGGRGIGVAEEWLCFATFAEDCKHLPGYVEFINDPGNYTLDKDYKQRNIPKEQRIYSKDTCIFMTNYDNNYFHAAYDYNRNNPNNPYVGVSLNTSAGGNYEVKIRTGRHDGKKKYIGTFSNPEAAANAYNYFFLKYNRSTMFKEPPNDVPYMGPLEFFKYNTNPKEMCKVVDKDKKDDIKKY